METLTEREREIALRVAQGYSNQDIGEQLGIDAKTVRWHLTHIYPKLNLKNRAQLAAYVWRQGWLK